MTVRSCEVRVSHKKTVQFCSTEFSFSMTMDLDEGDDPDIVMEECRDQLKQRIRDAFQKPNGDGGGLCR